MGCCASTNHRAASASQHHRHSTAARSDASRHSKAAPPPEEETVKEVLSETPTPKPPIPKIEDEEKKRGSRPPLHLIREEDDDNVEKKKTPLMITEETSEVSEICSLSESLSTVTEKREDDGGEVQQRVDRSPAKFRNRTFSSDRRERTTAVGRSPARRSEPSPGRVRSVPGRERRAVAADGKKRDCGESSGRRSRSPATRAAAAEGGAARGGGLGRSPSGRKTGKSPARDRSDLHERTRKPEETTKWPPPTTNESLENPLVSLECFIFL